MSQARLPKFLEDLDPEIFLSDNYVVLDFEIDTSHGDYGNPIHSANQLLLASWKTSKGHTKAQCGNEYADWESLRQDIQQADFIVAHNAKYELGWLKRLGVDLRTVFAFDTQIAEYVLL